MNGYRFYAEMQPERATKSASKRYLAFNRTILREMANAGELNNVIAVPLKNGRPLYQGRTLKMDAIAAVTGRSNSGVTCCSVTSDYLRRRCVRIDSELARKLHPALFAFLGFSVPAVNDELDDFTRHYIVAALWSSDDDRGEPMVANYSIDDIEPETLECMKADCERFQNAARVLLATVYPLYDEKGMSGHPDSGSAQACAGHDFWLTRNSHGSGFWDRGFGVIGEQLSTLVGHGTEFPPFELYIDDDGKVRGS